MMGHSSISNHQSSIINPRGVFAAAVLGNERVGECFYQMNLEFTGAGARAFAEFRAGQFIQVDVSAVALPPEDQIPPYLRDACRRNILLRRPFSFADVTVEPGRTTAELLYCALGPASLRMTTLARGDALSIVGPLGNGFWVPHGKRLALLVVGGMGAPPIRCLAKSLATEHRDMAMFSFVGAKTVKSLPFEGQFAGASEEMSLSIPAFKKFGIPSAIATDDGSSGYRGFITDRLVRWLDEEDDWSAESTVIYACGPEAMLAALARAARERKIDCQVSMERRMACGIGVCQSCADECRMEESKETLYQLCCQDGPVFDARIVVFDV